MRAGFFKRSSDGRRIQRFRCAGCSRYFSYATLSPCFRQKKRQFNHRLYLHFSSFLSQRRAAKVFGLSRNTVVRKFLFLAAQAELEFHRSHAGLPKASTVEFDDLETFEHTKLKPLSITLAIEAPSRRILGFEVSAMPAKGKLVSRAMKKYGPRKDERARGRARLFQSLKSLIEPEALIKSDSNPHYPRDVKRHFPRAMHEAHKGQRGSIVGQGELKAVRFDPLFSLNHTCAMLRANINRLGRKTWCTTKLPDRLRAHLYIYARFHNFSMLDST